jgi:hypothetical protein
MKTSPTILKKRTRFFPALLGGAASLIANKRTNKSMNRKLLLTIAVFASAALTARANLVDNPGFETGDFSGWTQWGDSIFDRVCDGCSVVGTNHSGSFMADFTPDPGYPSGIRQTISGSAGIYNVDFWLSSYGGGVGEGAFGASLGGVAFYGMGETGPFGWTHITGTVATGADPLLEFTFFVGLPDAWGLDDVNVVKTPDSGGTLSLFALGALGLAAASRIRTANAS